MQSPAAVANVVSDSTETTARCRRSPTRPPAITAQVPAVSAITGDSPA
jgi:hypothetical protein